MDRLEGSSPHAPRRRAPIRLLIAAVFVAAVAAPAAAQTWPVRAVRIVVSYILAGGVDIVARLMA